MKSTLRNKNTFELTGLVLSLLLFISLLGEKSEETNAYLLGYSKIKITLLLLSFFILTLNCLIFFFNRNRQSCITNIINKLFYKIKNFYAAIIFLFLLIVFIVIIYINLFSQTDIPSYIILKTIPLLLMVLILLIELLVLLAYLRLKSEENIRNFLRKMETYDFFLLFVKEILVFYGLYFIVKVITIMLIRLDYPFELEWMEGGSLIQVNRLLNGLPLYTKPSIYYVPSIYTPLYFYFSSFLARLVGFGFLPLRLISFCATIGVSILTYLVVHRENKDILLALISVGIFSSMFKSAGAWFDIARVDSLLYFFLLLGIFLSRSERKFPLIFSGVFFSLAVYTKQTAIIPICFIFIFLLTSNKKRFYLSGLSFLLICILLFVVFESSSNGWFSYIVFNKSSTYSINLSSSLNLIYQMIQPIIILFIPTSYFFIHTIIRKETNIFLFFGMMIIGLFSFSLIHKLPGGYDNVLIPFYGGIAIISSLGLKYIFDDLKSNGKKIVQVSIPLFLILLIIVQFTRLDYSVIKQIPTREDYRIGESIINKINNIKGEVYFSSASYLNLYANKQTYAHWISIMEFLGEFGGSASDTGISIHNELTDLIEQKQFEMVVLDTPPSNYELDLDDDYELEFELDCDCFYPKTGSMTRPTLFYSLKN